MGLWPWGYMVLWESMCLCGLLFLFPEEKKSRPEHTQVTEN